MKRLLEILNLENIPRNKLMFVNIKFIILYWTPEFPSSTMLRVPPLVSETKWTEVLWSKSVYLIMENKEGIIFSSSFSIYFVSNCVQWIRSIANCLLQVQLCYREEIYRKLGDFLKENEKLLLCMSIPFRRSCKIQCTFDCHRVGKIMAPLFCICLIPTLRLKMTAPDRAFRLCRLLVLCFCFSLVFVPKK